VVEAVIERGESADAALAAQPAGASAAAVRAIALGTLRWYLRLAPAVRLLLSRPSGVPSLVRSLLTVAAHQVEYSRNAPEASVHGAVDAARLLGEPRATGLVNAVLRRFVAERASLLRQIDSSPQGRSAHPAWLVRRITAAWPQAAESVLAADNQHPPMTLRVDLTRTTRTGYVSRLAGTSIDANAIQWMPSAVTLDLPVAVSRLPGFEEGLVSVQDAGAQLAAPLLEAGPRMRVLDLCAAPGGKTGHLLEILPDQANITYDQATIARDQASIDSDQPRVTAVDIDAGRVALIAGNLKRLRRSADVRIGDASDPASFWDGRPYERILVDAPCSSTGVIRRHPDIKLLRRETDIASFAATQLAILRSAVTMLAPGGRMLYSTCSVLPEENEQVIAALLALEPALAERSLVIPAPGALARQFGVQLLPGAEAGTDGFYYACLEKTTSAMSTR
jgi:16S rRNA (cytosine967-C5)-methyltransferase